jgi:AraC-like DNA-binding protein
MTMPPPPGEPQLEYLAPSRDMGGIVHTLFVLRAGEGRSHSMMPAYSAQAHLFLEGEAEVHFPERAVGRSSDLCFSAPVLRAAPMVLTGPITIVGASFSPLGWAHFSGLAADKVHDAVLDAEAVFPGCHCQDPWACVHADLARMREGAMTPEEGCRSLENLIREVCAASNRAPRAAHAELVAAIEAWLESGFSPPVESLYEKIDLGPRQVQRLCRRYFGVPPAQLVKRYRAIRAAMLLAHEELSEELRNEVLSTYFDQAHLIHDIRRYTGYTPGGLASERLAQHFLNPDGHGATGNKLRKR